jgi:hypothetical protein
MCTAGVEACEGMAAAQATPLLALQATTGNVT